MDQKPLYYEVDPEKSIRPVYNGVPIQAQVINIWANSAQNPAIRWRDKTYTEQVVNGSYQGQLEDYFCRF